MKTDDLITALAADTQIEGPIRAVLVGRLAVALAVTGLMIWITLGFRDDLMRLLATPLFAVRFAMTAALGLIGLRLAFVIARPEGHGFARLWPIAAVTGVALGLLIWAYVVTPFEDRQTALMGKTLVTCLIAIPLLSILPVTAILVSMRNGATTAPAMAGFVAGVAGGAFAAMVFALHCIEDSPLFYVTWYGLAITGVALISSVIGAKVLRW